MGDWGVQAGSGDDHWTATLAQNLEQNDQRLGRGVGMIFFMGGGGGGGGCKFIEFLKCSALCA